MASCAGVQRPWVELILIAKAGYCEGPRAAGGTEKVILAAWVSDSPNKEIVSALHLCYLCCKWRLCFRFLATQTQTTTQKLFIITLLGQWLRHIPS